MAEQAGGRELRAVMNRARLEAIEAGSRDVRAEHLLLALLDDSSGGTAGSRVGSVLAELGLTRERLADALRIEWAHSLAAVGFTELKTDRLTATRLPSTPSMGGSVREALLIGHRTASRERVAEQRAAHRSRARRGRDGGDQQGANDPVDRAARSGHSSARRAGFGEFALAIGALSAELGTVPRALIFAGLDREVLLEALRRAALDG